ncbi:MAG: IS3 family transposase [Desulfobacteraceae bacterium]|nr:IS3 family transposase [Desulfobacteraceae bacterium]
MLQPPQFCIKNSFLYKILQGEYFAVFHFKKNYFLKKSIGYLQLRTKKIKRIFFEYKERYGSPRIAKELKEQGITCSKNRVCRLMKQERLMPKARR